MIFRLLLVATLVVTAFTSGLIQDEEDLPGAASSHSLNDEFPAHDIVSTGDGAGPEPELKRKPRRASKQCPGDSHPQSCNDSTVRACFCDTIRECPDGEDEADCGPACPTGKERCGDEDTCIYHEQICDGYEDCQNKWDESNCDPNNTSPDLPTTITTRLQCPENSTLKQCDNGTTYACFCDFIEECPEGEDEKEENCSSDPLTSEPQASDSLSGGAIAGIIVAILVVVAVAIGVAKYKELI